MARTVAITIGHDGLTRDVTISVPDNEPAAWGMGHEFTAVKDKRIPRVDALEKVTGQAKYTHDIHRPNMLHAALVTCPYAKASIGTIDLTEAKAMPGVVDIRATTASSAQYTGHLIAVVAAETPQQALDAARQVQVSYTPQAFKVEALPEDEAGHGGLAPQSLQEGRVPLMPPANRGNVDNGFSQADGIHEATYETQVTPHCTLETHGCVVEWNNGELTVWTSTQGIWSSRSACAAAARISASLTRVITNYMGGGFGSKLQIEDFFTQCIQIAKDTGRPVKLMATRYEDLIRSGNKPGSRQTVRIGAKNDGTLTAIDAKISVITGYSGSDSYAAPYHDGYDCPNIRVSESTVRLNAGASRAFRAPGRPQGTFALEMAIEELAAKLDIDPVQLRMKNVKTSELDCRLHALQVGAERFGWAGKFTKHGSQSGVVRRGVGCAVTTWPYYGSPGAAMARCTLFPDGSVEIANACQDLGTGSRTAMAATAAETLGIGPEAIKILMGDTQLGLIGPESSGSVTTSNVAPAVRSAAYKAQQRVFALAAQQWGIAVENVACQNGVVYAMDNPALAMSWREAAALMGVDPISATAQNPAMPSVRGVTLGTQMRGAQFAEVEVDTATGRVRCLKIVAVQDCGIAMARAQAESQICGGVIMGVSYALSEDRILDNLTGRPLNASMETGKLLSPWQTPEIEVVLIDVYDPVNNCCAKGLGEPPHIPTAAAVGCAVFNALGVPVRSLPITPYKVLRALKERKG